MPLLSHTYKTKGSALMYAMIFMLVISAMCGGLLSIGHISKTSQININHIQRAQLNMQSALALIKQSISIQEITNYISLRPAESVNTQIKQWGMYRSLCIVSNSGGYGFKKCFLLGSSNLNNQPTLTLPENRHELRYGEDVILKGKVYVPQGKLDKVYAKSENRKGNIKISAFNAPHTFPQVDIIENQKFIDHSPEEVIYYADIDADSIYRSFKQSTLQIICEPSQLIANIYLAGNIELTGGNVRLSQTAHLDQVHVVCNELSIQRGFQGRLHASVKYLAQIEDSVHLFYPSSLHTRIDKAIESNKKRGIYIGQNCEISGVIALTQEPGLRNSSKPQITLGNSSKVMGEIYCDGNANLRGFISGSVYAKEVVGSNQASSYGHTLMGVSITNEVPAAFVGALFNSDQNLVASCLN